MSAERSDQTRTSADMRQLLVRAHSTIASLKQQLNAAYAPATPVAVTGVGLRLPGGVASVEQFWDALQSGRIACAEAPTNRQFHTGATDGRIRYGSFISDVESFDPEFFGITAVEAERMDPQQRVSLMVASEAIVDAGIAVRAVARRNVGVYFGVCGHDHYGVELNGGADISAYSGAGVSSSIVANRLSYLFDFSGPSMAVDSACSSSLVAAHLALQGLASGECELALVGGVNLMLSEGVSRAHAAAGMLALDGRCKTFDARADGFGRGEGCVVLVLEPLEAARARRCHIYGLIHGSAVNQDGRSNGLTAPNLNAQREVILAALTNARMPAEAIGMIEAHGTGTPLGDPIEVAALREVFDTGSGRHPCWLTAVKPNLGHLEGAAGVAGLLKALQCVQRGIIPPLAGFNAPNPHLALDDSALKLALTGTDWNVAERRAGVSSFGFGGTNAHLIVGNVTASVEAANTVADYPFQINSAERVLCLSAHSRAALLMHVEAVVRWLDKAVQSEVAARGDTAVEDKGPDVTVRDVCATFALQRDAFQHRVAVIGSTFGELARELRAFAGGRASARAFHGIVKDDQSRRVCGLVPGQGSQLTTELPALFALFDGLEERWRNAVESLEQAGRLPARHSGSPLETDCAQPLLGLYTQVAHELWSRFGVRPSILLGHSVGELIACGLAGSLQAPGLWDLLCARGCALQDSCAPGAMISIAVGLHPVDELLSRFPELDLAADNGAGGVVLAGPSSEVSRLQTWADEQGLKTKLLEVTRAFHSRLMDTAEPVLRDLFAGASFRAPRDSVVSSLTGGVLSEVQLQADHWLRHVREPVRFAQAVVTAAAQSDVWLELGPGSTLCGLVGAELGQTAVCIPTQHRRAAAAEALLGALAQLFVNGVTIRWDEVFGATRCVPELPTVGWDLRQFPLRHLVASENTPMPEELRVEFEPLPGVGLSPLEGRCLLVAVHDAQAWRDRLWARGVQCVSDPSLLTGPADAVLFVAQQTGISDELPVAACIELLYAARGAFEAARGAKRRLVIVVGVETEFASRLLAEALWGVASSIRAEWSDLDLLVVEAEGRSREDVLDALMARAAVTIEAERVRWVNNTWAARRLKRSPRKIVPAWAPDPDATYLLSGGRGALGLKLAKWLVARGARSLVLAGRRPMSDVVTAAVERLQAQGARVQCPTLDVADRRAVQDWFARAASDGVVVRGVFHLAGVVEDKGFRNLPEGQLSAGYAAKVGGAVNLIDAGGAGLELFVATSSLAGILGSAGQCAYSCANAALDAYVEHSAGGGRKLSCALGPVTDVGMYAALAQHQRDRVAVMGFVAHTADEYFAAMAQAIAGEERHVVLATISGAALAEALPPAARGLIAHLTSNAASEQLAPAGAWDLNELCSEPQPTGIMERLRSLARALLGGQELVLPGDTGFVDLGFDSLLAVEFRNRLSRAMGDRMVLTATLIYDYPTLNALGAYLIDGLGLSRDEPSESGAIRLAQVQSGLPGPADARAVAVVAMACRFPGGVRDVGAYWTMISRGLDGVRPFPDDRWSSDYASRATELKDLRAATIDGPYEWAPEDFGVAPREASSIDPQQRLLVELTAEALEQAGIEVGALDKRRVGVFVGIGVPDFAQLQLLEGDLDNVDGYFGSGTTLSAAAGRIAFCFGFQGPCLAVDTACSSSLVAVHLARKALLAGECDWAVVGGVSLLLSPAPFLNLSRAGMLAPDGRCKPFQNSADGFGRGEGCGVILLRRASDARDDGNFIWSMISGSAVNQDGRTATLTAPNGPAQVAVIEQALAEAGRSPMDIDYVEAHGTGTALGDPMEAQALGTAYRSRGEESGRQLSIGSVKANIGHLEAGAGLAGLIKTVLAVHQAKLPPQPAGDPLSDKVDWFRLSLRLQTEIAAWPNASVRCAGVSSFGFVGTNAHVIVESVQPMRTEKGELDSRPALVTLCSPSREALLRRRDAIAGLADLLPAETPVHDFLRSVRGSDPHHACHRMAGVVTSCSELAPLLNGEFVEGGEKVGLFVSSSEGALHPPRVAWLFSGQGTQSVGMARMLAENFPPFREAVRECEACLPLAHHGVFDALLDPDSGQDVEQTHICQPMIFVYQIALARLWTSFGLRPSYVLGHSVGEFAAAVVAGILDLPSALRLVVARGRLMAEATPEAAMLGLRCNGPRAAELAATFGLDIAAYNSPSSTTVSGETKAIEALELSCLGLGISTRRLHVSRAFHSRQMNGICTPLRQELEGIEFADATVPILRGLDGQVDADGVMSRREYWIEQSLQAVNFEQGLRTLRGQSVTSFVEIGPQPALVGLAREVVGDAQALYLASQRRQETSPVTLLGSVAQLYVAGANPSWKHLEPAWQTTRVPFPLPSKPRVYREYRPRVAHATARAGARIPEGVAAWPGIVYFGPGERWTSRLRISARAADSFWADHRIFGETVVPGAAHLAWVIGGAIGQNWPKVVVSDVEFVRPLFLRSSDTELQCLVEPGLQGQYRVVVASRASNSNRYVEHMRATLTREAHSEATEPTAVAPVSGEWQVESGAEFYKLRIPSALALGASFRWVDRVQRQGLRAFAVLIAPQGLSAEWLQPGPFPGLIDSCFQTCMATFDAQKGDVWVPVGIHRVDWIAASDCHEVNVLVQRSAQSAQGMEEVSADVEVYDSGRRLVARFVGLRARRLREEHMQSGPGLNYVRTWQAALVPPSKSCRVMLLGGSRALRDALLAQSDAHLFLTDGGALPTDPHAFDDHLSRQVALAEQSDCGLAYLEEAESPDMTSMSWQHDAARAARLIMFAKELKRQRWQDRAVFLFSRCVTQISAEAELLLGTPSGAFTWGVGPCISRVLRNAPVRVVDVSAQPVVLLAQELSLALRAADDELVAVRAQRLYRARLQRQAPREQNPEAGHAAREGAWLVTGGLSGLGFETAKWLAQRGAAELVLMGRRSPSEEIATELATLKAGGTCVWVASGDVSELSDLQRIFDKYPRIRNIVHAAGELADRPLEEVTERDVQTCFRAKVGGALNLEQVSRSHNVERLIMFASAAGWIGSAGQIAYAAANAKLEDIAVARNRRGQATFIVAFGPFDGTGMASRLAAPLRQRQEAAGVSFHSVERGLESLSLALGDTPTSFMALDVNWGNFVQSLVNAQATVPSWVPQDASGPERKAPSKDRSTGALKDQLRQLPASLRLDSLMSTLREQIARVLQLDPQRLELGVGLFEVGLDSLMAVEIRDSLEQQLAAELEPTLLIDNSSLRLLAARLLTVCGLDDVVIGEAERDAPISHIATDVHRLSDDQVDGLLEELLGAE